MFWRLVKQFTVAVASLAALFIVAVIISGLIATKFSTPTDNAPTIVVDTDSGDTETIDTPPAEDPGVVTETPTPADTTAILLPEIKLPEIPVSVSLHVRDAVVNILCISQDSDVLPSISASGVLISPRGVILTNAHAAQHFLFEEEGLTECVIRNGNPAEPRYEAELLYLPEAWVIANPDTLTSPVALGTGEHDYAFLLVTSAVKGSKLPSSFTYVTPDPNASVGEPQTLELQLGTQIVVAGYPSEIFPSNTILSSLLPLSANARIMELFTFSDENTLDLISLGGSLVAQKGSSGGAVVGADSALKALVVTATDDKVLDDRELRAITLGHIERSLITFTGSGVNVLISGSVEQKVQTFGRSSAPDLADILLQELDD